MPWARVDGILADAAHAQQAWARTDIAARGETLLAVAAELRRLLDELAMLAVHEMGKPVAEAKAELICPVAVSYTHLDVYKRQGQI